MGFKIAKIRDTFYVYCYGSMNWWCAAIYGHGLSILYPELPVLEFPHVFKCNTLNGITMNIVLGLKNSVLQKRGKLSGKIYFCK